MGLIHLGAPFDVIPQLANLCHLNAFVETGTLFGGTALAATQYFDKVYTIEKSQTLYRQYHAGLRASGRVEPLLGDSRTILPEVLATLAGKPALFWLDGHWSGGETAGETDECPLMAELEILSSRVGDVILIDDARLFLSAPDAPHDPTVWPTISEISVALSRRSVQPYVQVIDDVIFVVPAQDDVKKILIDYGRTRSAAFWAAYEKGRPKRSLAKKVANRIARLTNSE